MNLFWYSAGLVVLSNVAYHIFQKSIPSTVNPVGSIIVTYGIAMAVSLVLLPFFSPDSNPLHVARNLNWANALLGLAIIGIEIGYLMLYRIGGNVSGGQVLCNSIVALVLVPVGVLLFKEKLILANYIGIVLAVVGIYCITLK